MSASPIFELRGVGKSFPGVRALAGVSQQFAPGEIHALLGENGAGKSTAMKNPYNQDNETTWLDWSLLEKNREMFRFFQRMIAFRKSRRALGRSRFWREDLQWYGASDEPDLTQESRSIAWRLRDGKFDEGDLYVMINAGEQPLKFHIQERSAADWQRVVDTSLPSPEDIVEPGKGQPIKSLDYEVGPRAVVVLTRRHSLQP